MQAAESKADVGSVHAELERIESRLRKIADAMEPEFSDALRAGDIDEVRRIAARHNISNGEYARLIDKRWKMKTELARVHPGWDA